MINRAHFLWSGLSSSHDEFPDTPCMKRVYRDQKRRRSTGVRKLENSPSKDQLASKSQSDNFKCSRNRSPGSVRSCTVGSRRGKRVAARRGKRVA